MTGKIIVDAKNSSLGRVASYAAKQALLGNSIFIVNCNDALVGGNRQSILEEYREARARGGSSMKGPFFPKIPERVMKRTVRGMLKHRTGRGREAFKRIMCYNEIPAEHREAKMVSFPKEFKIKTITLKELFKLI